MSKPRIHNVEQGKGIHKEREVNRRREFCVWVVCVCVSVDEVDVATLRFALGVERSAVETELILVVFRMLTSRGGNRVTVTTGMKGIELEGGLL